MTNRDRVTIAVFVAMVAVVAALLAVQTWQEQFSTDVYHHLAVFRELSANPFNPSNDTVSAVEPTYMYSPYSVALGMLGWMSGMEPIKLLQVGAAVNMVLFASGLWLFSRSFSPYRWTPHLTLFFSLVAWGVNSWRWSGYWGLNSIGFGLGYPSMFASGLALIALAGLCRFFITRSRWTIVAVGIAAAVIAPTHPIVLVWFSIAAVAIVAVQTPSVLRETMPSLLAVGVLAIGLAVLWPYYSILALAHQASDGSAVHTDLYRGVFLRSFLMLPGAAALVLRARRSLRDPLVWMFVAGVTVYSAGYLTGAYEFGRVAPLIALSAHVAMADVAASWLMDRDRRRTGIAWAGIAVIGVVGMLGSVGGLVRMVPVAMLPASLAQDERLTRMIESYASLDGILGPTDVAFTSGRMMLVVPAVVGRVVVPGYIAPLLSDRTSRERAGLAFFSDDSSTADRDAIASRWGATHVVVDPADIAVYPWLRDSYRVIAETDEFVVVSLK